MGQETTEVTYRYCLKQVASWAEDPELRRAYPYLERELATRSTPHETAAILVRTSDGWAGRSHAVDARDGKEEPGGTEEGCGVLPRPSDLRWIAPAHCWRASWRGGNVATKRGRVSGARRGKGPLFRSDRIVLGSTAAGAGASAGAQRGMQFLTLLIRQIICEAWIL
jgi:hypothetical protein